MKDKIEDEMNAEEIADNQTHEHNLQPMILNMNFLYFTLRKVG